MIVDNPMERASELHPESYPQSLWISYPHHPQLGYANFGYPHLMWITYPHFPHYGYS